MAVILFHPTLLARRAREIARSQGATRLDQDACGRPFVRSVPKAGLPPSGGVQAPDPLRECPAAANDQPRPIERLIRAVLAWLPPTEAPGRVQAPRSIRSWGT